MTPEPTYPPPMDNEITACGKLLTLAMVTLHKGGSGTYTFRLWRTQYIVTVERGAMTVKEKKMPKVPYFFCMLVLLFCATAALAEPNATVLYVIDGDTAWMNMDCQKVGRDRVECGRVPVRTRAIDTAEIHGKCPREITLAAAAKQAVKNLLSPGDRITLSNVGLDKYGRILASIQNKDSVDVGGELLKRGLAHSYDGGTKRSWCP